MLDAKRRAEDRDVSKIRVGTISYPMLGKSCHKIIINAYNTSVSNGMQWKVSRDAILMLCI